MQPYFVLVHRHQWPRTRPSCRAPSEVWMKPCVQTWHSGTVPENDSWWALMWTHFLFKYPSQNSGTVPVPSTRSQPCTRALHWALIPYVHTSFMLVPLHFTHSPLLCVATIPCTCSVCWMWTYRHIGYPVSEHGTILCWCLGTSARAPIVNTVLEVRLFTVLAHHLIWVNIRYQYHFIYGAHFWQ